MGLPMEVLGRVFVATNDFCDQFSLWALGNVRDVRDNKMN